MDQLRQWGRAAVGYALLLICAGVLLAACSPPTPPEAKSQTLWLITSTGMEKQIDVEIAETAEQKRVGLMFRTELPDGKGMLFPNDSPQEMTMWMRNTYIPLDMVFIRPDGVVHRIEKQTEPHSERIIRSDGPVKAVLEIAGGASDRMGLKPGDRVRHPLFGTGDP